MNVLFITHYPDLLGANRSLLSLIDGLNLKSLKCYVVCPSLGNLTNTLDKNKISYLIWPVQMCMANYKSSNAFFLFYRRNYERFVRLIKTIYNMPVLIRQAKKWDIDIIYSNSSVTIAGFLLSRLINKPHVWHIREYATLHYNYILDFSESVFRRLLLKSERLVFVSKALKNFYLGALKNEKAAVIYNGVLKIKEFPKLLTKKEQNDAFTFLMVGLISKNKGQIEAIEAFNLLHKKFPFAKLVIVGSGDVESCEKKITELKLQNRVILKGYIEDVAEIYLNSDSLLMCSKNEGMGRVTAEAMAYELPVIGRNSGGTSELIEHNISGLLYEDDYLQLSHMMELLIKDRILYNSIQINAFEFAKDNFTIEKYTNTIYKILESINKHYG